MYRHTSFYCASQILHFYELKVCGNLASSKCIGAIFPAAFAHFVFLYILVIHTFQTFLLLYLLWWSVISDLWCYGAHEWHSSRMANLIDKCLCSDCSIDQLFSFSLFRHLYSLRHKYILAQIGPINHLTMVSKCSSEESYMSYFKSQGRNVET